MNKILLIIEKGNGAINGRVHYEDNLIIESSDTIENLENNMKLLLQDFHGLDAKKIEFEYVYDITSLFDKFSYLKITSIAKKAHINPSLLRQYASGVKYPSSKQAKKLESTIHEIGKELIDVALYVG